MNNQDKAHKKILITVASFAVGGAYAVFIFCLDWMAMPRQVFDSSIIDKKLFDMLIATGSGDNVFWGLLSFMARLYDLEHGQMVFYFIVLVLCLICYYVVLRFGNGHNMVALKAHMVQTPLAWCIGAICFLILALVLYIVVVTLGMTHQDTDTAYIFYCLIIACIVLFLVVGEGGWLSCLGGADRAIKRVLARGFITGVIFSLLYILRTYFIDYFEQIFSVLNGADSFTVLGLKRMLVFGAIEEAIFFSCIGTLLIMMLPRTKTRVRVKQALFPILLFAAYVTCGFIFVYYCNTALDMRYASLSEAASLTVFNEEDRSRAQFVLTDIKHKKKEPKHVHTDCCCHSTGEHFYLEENVKKLNDYLDRQNGKITVYTFEAMEMRRRIAESYWLVDESREIMMKNIKGKADLFNSYELLRSLIHAPVTEQNRKLLENLSDEEQFHIGKLGGSLKLAKLWASFSEKEKSETWFAWYKKARIEMYMEEQEGDYAFASMTDGRLSGRVKGSEIKGARVGLFMFWKDDSLNSGGKLRIYGKPRAAMELRTDGIFEFTNLIEGSYYFGLLLPRDVKGQFDVKGGGVFEISEKTPVVNVGTIKVSRPKFLKVETKRNLVARE